MTNNTQAAIEALDRAGNQFCFYKVEHHKKGNADKAKVNQELSHSCFKAASRLKTLQRKPVDVEIKLKRWGVTWGNGKNEPILSPMEDGYWTPWHIVNIYLNTPPQSPVTKEEAEVALMWFDRNLVEESCKAGYSAQHIGDVHLTECEEITRKCLQAVCDG